MREDVLANRKAGRTAEVERLYELLERAIRRRASVPSDHRKLYKEFVDLVSVLGGLVPGVMAKNVTKGFVKWAKQGSNKRVEVCDWCFKAGSDSHMLAMCARCKIPMYCLKGTCQKEAWKQGGHRENCFDVKQKLEDERKV